MNYDTNLWEELLNQNGIFCHLVDLPTYIKGYTVKKEDNYIIIINSKFSHHTRKKTLIHELLHIELGHLEIEQIAEKYPILEKEVLTILNQAT